MTYLAKYRNGTMKILEIGEETSGTVAVSNLRLIYHFDDMEDVNGSMCVPAGTRDLSADFERHVLNRPMAQIILRERPDAIFIRGLHGCTLDLPRVARLLGLPVCLEPGPGLKLEGLESRTSLVLESVLRSVDILVGETYCGTETGSDRSQVRVGTREEGLAELARMQGRSFADGMDYALYEFCLRDHPLLVAMQRQYLTHFAGCETVLDLGCGAGVFLDLLAGAGINAQGVERSPVIAEYARGMGLAVETADALDFLRSSSLRFDGIYCSHFIEHFPFESVRDLVGLLAGALKPGGVLVLVFPDPESIRSQLLGFWRDPEHVRFYHPELIELLGQTVGLNCEWSSHRAVPHVVTSFPAEAVGLPEVGGSWPDEAASALESKVAGDFSGTWFERLLRRIGLAPLRSVDALAVRTDQLSRRLADLSQEMTKQTLCAQKLVERVDLLWTVNQTWAWDDNAVLRFRKP